VFVAGLIVFSLTFAFRWLNDVSLRLERRLPAPLLDAFALAFSLFVAFGWFLSSLLALLVYLPIAAYFLFTPFGWLHWYFYSRARKEGHLFPPEELLKDDEGRENFSA